MIPTTTQDIKVQNNFGGHQVAMTIDAAAMAHIMGLLTNLYSNPELAIVREYSTNAWDSHIAAGVSKPIEITTPSPLSPFLKIKDYGVGMSQEDIENIYSKYGASTKRETNSQNGMLGLGCKSALTYTNQFTLVGIKDGVKTHVAISRTEDGSGVMEVVDTSNTNEPNGVEVVIPVKKYQDIIKEVNNFFRFWEAGTVLINGKDPEFLEGKEVSPGIFFVDNLQSDYIVMGNVAYPLGNKQLTNKSWYAKFGVVAFVEMGSVHFTPSRENLHYTDLTLTTIERVRKEVQDNLKQAISDDIAGSATHAEAIENFMKWQSYVNRIDGVVYKGETVPHEFRAPMGKEFIIYTPHKERYSVSREKEIDYKILSQQNFVIVYDFKSEKLSSTQKAKLRKWVTGKNVQIRAFLISEEIPGHPWTEKIESVSWNDVNKIKLNNSARNSTGSPQFTVLCDTYPYYEDTEEIDDTGEIIYCSPAEFKNHSDRQLLTQAFPDATIVLVNRNRWEKFVRNFPTARHFHEPIREMVEAAAKAFTHLDKIVYTAGWHDRNVFSRLDINKIDDPEVVNFINAIKVGETTDNTKAYINARRLANAFEVSHSVEIESVKSPLSKYPLLSNAGYNSRGHEYIYMNAVYNQEKNNEV